MCIIKKEIEESNLTCNGLEGKEECERCPCREEVTEREAINFLRLEGIEVKGNPRRLAEFFDGLDVAITALEEIQEYRAIGTVEECRRAMKNKMELPCAVGSLVYEPYQFMGEGAWEIDVHKIRLEDLNKIGKTVFLTKEEAEATLKEWRARKYEIN